MRKTKNYQKNPLASGIEKIHPDFSEEGMERRKAC